MGAKQAKGEELGHLATRTLRLFNEKADKLEALSFTETLISEPLAFHLKYDSEKGGAAWRTGPRGESVDAFILTFRYFVQDNEPTSLRNMTRLHDDLYAVSLVPQTIAEEFRAARNHVNEVLDSEMHMEYNGKQLTRRDVYEVFLWGGLAHANKTKKALYDEWRDFPLPMFFLMLEREFIATLGRILGAIFAMRDINTRALEAITTQAP